MKIYFKKAILVLLGFSLLWTISIFVAPATLEPGSMQGLDGTGGFDHADNLEGLDPFNYFVYGFGDSQCHQKEARSFKINDNQLPLCARCMSLYVWANLGILTAMLVKPEYEVSATAIKIFPKRLQQWIKKRNLVMTAWIVLMVVSILPTALDGFTQLFTTYTSNNLNRIVFSLPTGWFGGFAIGLMLNNISYQKEVLNNPYPPPGPISQAPVPGERGGARDGEE